MRLTLSILLAALCVSCLAVESRSKYAVSLPKLTTEGVNFDDGIQKEEAAALSSVYFDKFVSLCGMPDAPKEDGKFWRVELWCGFLPGPCGTLRIAKDGSEILLVPPR